MLAVSVFSGFDNSAWALASAVAMAPIVSLERCIGDLQQFEANCAGFGALGAQTVPDGFLGVLGHKLFQVRLGGLVLLVCGPRPAVGRCKFSPAVGRAHIHNPYCLEAWPWR